MWQDQSKVFNCNRIEALAAMASKAEHANPARTAPAETVFCTCFKCSTTVHVIVLNENSAMAADGAAPSSGRLQRALGGSQ